METMTTTRETARAVDARLGLPGLCDRYVSTGLLRIVERDEQDEGGYRK
jgi:hypothetical protein